MSGVDPSLVQAALPGYEIGDELGRGSFGVVWRGEHRSLGRRVAIKLLPHSVAVDEQASQRFEAEARLVASFDHPHIVPVYDFVEHDGLRLLVLEFMDGGTLAERRAGDGFDGRQACATALAVLAALQYAHERGVLHRDVKPDNILFGGDTPKLTDFGIAKQLQADATLTAAGTVIGTPRYMSPEQAEGRAIAASADVFSLGLVLYECLAGRTPYRPVETVSQEIVQRIQVPPSPLAEVAPGVDAGLAAVVDRALAHAADDRYVTATAFAEDLAAASTAAFGPGWLAATAISVTASATVLAATESGVAGFVPPPSPPRPAATSTGTPPGRRGVLVGALLGVVGLAALLALLVVLTRGDDSTSTSPDTAVETGAVTTTVAPSTGRDGPRLQRPDWVPDGDLPTTSDGETVQLRDLLVFSEGCDANGLTGAECLCIFNALVPNVDAPTLESMIDGLFTGSGLPDQVPQVAQQCADAIDGAVGLTIPRRDDG